MRIMDPRTHGEGISGLFSAELPGLSKITLSHIKGASDRAMESAIHNFASTDIFHREWCLRILQQHLSA